MKFSQVMKRCEENGIKISKQGLYLAGLKNGFIERDADHCNIFHKEKFEQWVEKNFEKIPEGYKTILECSKELNKSLPWIYWLIKNGKLEVKEIGTRRIKVVKFEELKKYIEFRQYGGEEEYGN